METLTFPEASGPHTPVMGLLYSYTDLDKRQDVFFLHTQLREYNGVVA
jgi:hypothetical protein